MHTRLDQCTVLYRVVPVVYALGSGHNKLKLVITTRSTSIFPDISVIFVVVALSYSRRSRSIGAHDYDRDKCYDYGKASTKLKLHARIQRDPRIEQQWSNILI